MRGLFVALGVFLLCAGVVALVLCGCSGSGNGGGGGGPVVPLGNNHIYTGGERWTYTLTGTFRQAGGATTAIGPVAATLTIDAAMTPLQLAPLDAWVFKLNASYSLPRGDESFRHAFGFTQDRSGALALVGISGHLGDGEVPSRLDQPVTGLDLGGFPGATTWSGTSDVPTWGTFSADAQYERTENIAVGGRTFAAHKVNGTYDLGGFPVDLTTWFNPSVGCFVKMTEHWEEFDGSTMDLSFALDSTNVAYQ